MSGKTLDKLVPKTVIGDVQRAGTALIIPEGMSGDQAIDLIKRRMEFEESTVQIQEQFDTFPWDGAVALQRVMKREFGWVPALPTPGMFGDKPPALINIEVGPGQHETVPWGMFNLPHLNATLGLHAPRGKKGRVTFGIVVTCKRKCEDAVRGFLAKVREEIRNHSIYRGKAIKIRFNDDGGDRLDLPEVSFMDTRNVREEQLIYSDDLMASVTTNLFTPIRRAKECLANGIPLKRGVLLGGTYGCGKTLAAVVASKIAVDSGITFIYAENAGELGQAVEFAKQYQSPAAVVFCEDIDRSLSGARTYEMDAILNVIDGIESKDSNIMVVLTTNDLESINQAMIRPGRLDAVINVLPPDGKAVEKLIRAYGAGLVHPLAPLDEVGRELAGNIPAVIAEVVKRAKLSQLSLLPAGAALKEVTPAALLEAARTMTAQVALLRKDRTPKKVELEDALGRIFARVVHEGENFEAALN